MKKRKIAAGIIVIFIIIVVAVSYSLGYFSGEKPIGGDEDEHGCLIGAGYSFDEEVGACIRDWELNHEEKEAAKEAILNLNSLAEVTVLSVEKDTGEGCFNVTLQRNDNRELFNTKVILKNNYCSEEQKEADVCIEIYAPVCGVFKDGSKKTFGNSCFACQEDIEYWTNGEC